MKKILILVLFAGLFLTGCSSEKVQNTNCAEYLDGESWEIDCNTCTCENGTEVCTEIACTDDSFKENNTFLDEFKENVNLIKFNSNLSDSEQKYLAYYQTEYPHSKIYHIKTKIFNCEECYELYYKKDREILKIKVMAGEISQKSIIREDLASEIENADVCKLFSGEWNECPKVCDTDEEACITMCGLPTCEFNDKKITLKEEGEICGGLDEGDCKYSLTCFYENSEDMYGLCVDKK